MVARLERLLNLVIALRETRRPLPAAEIRRRVAGYGQPDHAAFRRMFERDKADLRALGVPLRTERTPGLDSVEGYRIRPSDYDLPEISLSAEELTALALAAELTGLGGDTGGALLALAVDADRPEAVRDPPSLPYGVGIAAPHLDVLQEAVATRTPVAFAYQPLGQAAAQRTVDPHALICAHGRWYLRGLDHARQAERTFRLDRIAGPVRSAGQPGAFQPPAQPPDPADVRPDPDPGWPDTALLRATDTVAWQVARRAHGGSTPDPTPGWARFTVPVGDLPSFVGWVVEFGAEVEVVAPPPAREAVVARLRAAWEAAR